MTTIQASVPVENQETKLTRSASYSEFQLNLKSCPLYTVNETDHHDKYVKVYIGSRDEDFDGFSLAFCSECDHEYDDTNDLCNNSECINSQEDDDEDDDF